METSGARDQSVQEVKKFTPNEIIALLVQQINSDSKDAFYKIAEQYQKSLAAGGEYSFKLKRLLNEKPKQFLTLSELSTDIKKLIIQKGIGQEYVFVPGPVQAIIDELLTEWKHSETFRYHNLGVRNKILLHGPTGNGKTTLARHIARLTELPFVEVNADMIIDSRLGSSGANIHRIFQEINMPCVLFWDEVDTIGRARGKGNDSAAGMENERMVNSILVNIEKLNHEVIFIGATNRKDVLDTAFLRRFDLEMEIPAPTLEQREAFIKSLLNYFKLPEHCAEDLSTDSLVNLASIHKALMERGRKHVLKEIEATLAQ